MSLMRASSSEPVSPVTLLMALGLTRSGTEVSASWISGAFVHIARLWPLILLAKICMVMMLRLPFFRLGDGVQAGLLALMLLVDGLVMILPRQERFRSLMPHVQNWAMLAMLFLSGLVYSLWLDGKLPAAPGAVLKLAVPELVVALLVACIVGDRRLLGMSYFLGLLLAAMAARAGLTQIALLASCMLVMAVATVRQALEDMRNDAFAADQVGNHVGIRRFATVIEDPEGTFLHLLALAEPAERANGDENTYRAALLEARDELAELVSAESAANRLRPKHQSMPLRGG